MALLGNSAVECRHLLMNGNRTSIALEVAFWRLMERRGDWRAWALAQLQDKPEQVGRARWLRVRILEDGGVL